MIKLNEILERHNQWLMPEEGGERANLEGVNLTGADLRGVNLTGADMAGADLRGVNLEDVNLTGADLWGANLRGVNLRNVSLMRANLIGANLEGVNLTWANLRDVNLTGADLRGVNLIGANLEGADMAGADLWGVAGNRKEIKSIWVSEVWPITYTSKILQIGCQQHSFEKWWAFSDTAIVAMHSDALRWWKEHKDFIKMTIERFPAK